MDEMRDLGQRYIAALWEAAGSFGTDAAAAARLGGLVEAIAEAEAQLAGLRLHLLHEAKLTGAYTVIDAARESVRTTYGRATASLKLADDLGERFELIAAALNDGIISLAQAEAIIAVLRKLPHWLTRADLEKCQRTMLEQAATLGPRELRIATKHLLSLVDPQRAEDEERNRLEAEERAALRDRYLKITKDDHGSYLFTAKLPVGKAAPIIAQLDALTPPASSYRDSGETPTREMRRADAFILLSQAAAAHGELPAHGGDRPRVVVTLDMDTLRTGLGRVGLPGLEADGLSAGEARRLACDATSIDNAVLLCPHHHRLVDPDPDQSPESQWQVHLDPVTGLPWFTPPRHIDPDRKPRQHPRHLQRELTPSTNAPPCPPDNGAEPDAGTTLDELIERSAAIWSTDHQEPMPSPSLEA